MAHLVRSLFKRSLQPTTIPALNIRHASSKGVRRRSGNRDNCISILDVIPRCHPTHPVIRKCQEEQKIQRKSVATFPFANLLLHPDCCDDPCKDMFARFDDIYYWPSDKANRCYRRTWNECKSPLCKPKLFCCYNTKPPCIEKRCPTEVKGVACEQGDAAIINACVKQVGCPSITMPCCKAALKPPKCKIYPSPAYCCKICTPYPSFSECKRGKLRGKPRRECECLERIDMCTLYELMRQGRVEIKKRFKLSG